ncbi:MAG: hydrogenase expression/formation protein HypE [Candidatus Dadabacteria bacterium]|nr:hydrogenase expression/formation protein HypE [Candidatus Dadabacteria bacterium]NIS08451.1 hydrogenase expression/formation protein HypE [Candidatus Dadabacteria bacterium]NIY21939.1 hydrogenase expression/formation protein HypE [Candidatus Dadabacteria bacterium]
MGKTKDFSLTCPIPLDQYPNMQIAHGGGGKLMNNMIEMMFLPAFDNEILNTRHDGAVVNFADSKIAFTTDSYVVSPLFFPGGDIGKLAVNGTVNDLAMCGARPLYISIGLIIEEGFPTETLWRVINSLKESAEIAGVKVVTGDTKVVEKGKGDGIYINTSGIGIIEKDILVSPSEVRPGDAILLNGDIARHGIAIMTLREGLEFETKIQSDSAPLAEPVLKLISEGIEIHCMRDLTRGGLASALVEISQVSNTHIQIDEAAIRLNNEVRGVCEILGLDPLHVANEGRFIAFVNPKDSEKALQIMREHDKDVSLIGFVKDDSQTIVTMKNLLGTNRIVDMISGEQLPRIC